MLSPLPIHPFTGLQAIALTRRGRPVWPVMGAADGDGSGDGGSTGGEPAGGEGKGQPPGQPPPQQQGAAGNADKGFPENTKPADMTAEQQAAYWKNHSRQNEDKSKQYNQLGLSPEEIRALQQRNEELENARLGADEKAAKEATKQAVEAAKAETEAVWKPKYQEAMLRSHASQVLKGEQLAAWMAGIDPARFAGDDGEIDAERVQTTLTAMFPQAGGQQQNNGQQQNPYQWGQHGGQPPNQQPGAGGMAEAQRRIQARQGVKPNQ